MLERKVVSIELTKEQKKQLREATGDDASALKVTVRTFEPEYEGFESREDFEEFRDYLLHWLPGMIQHLLRFNLTQAGLARSVGVSRVTMTNWLNGKRKPTLENLTKLIEAIEHGVDLLTSNLTAARDHLDWLRDVQEKLESGELPTKAKAPRRRKGK